MQFGGLILGLAFLTTGFFLNPNFGEHFKEDFYIYFGVLWLVLALIHRMQWKHKIALEEASQLSSHRMLKAIEDERAKWTRQTAED